MPFDLIPAIDWMAVQRKLRSLGFDPGPIDGAPGARTDAAIVAFKTSIGLRPRPYLGPVTLQALMISPVRYGPSPVPWMAEAAHVMGLHEARDTSQLRGWFDRSVAWIDPRDVPWCGAFIATCLRKWTPDIQIPDNPLGARNWLGFGQAAKPGFGAVMVFWRGSRSGWKGHVAFYLGEDATHYHIRGGNQRNAVTDTRIDKSRLLAARLPAGFVGKSRPVLLTAKGLPVSVNEA